MAFRARFRNYSIEQNLDEWVTPLVEQRVLGFTSKAQVMHHALRTLIDSYLEWGIHPWSTHKREESRLVSKAAMAVFLLLAGVGFTATIAGGLGGITGAVVGTSLNIPATYDQYALFIDFFIYFAFFLGVVQVALARTLPSRAVAVSLALALAIGVAAMEPVLGFNLKSFGPVALGFFILLVGFLIYRTLCAFEIHRFGAVAIAFFLLYFGLLLYMPRFYEWLSVKFPVLPFALIVVLVFLVMKLSDRLMPFPHGRGLPGRPGPTPGPLPAPIPVPREWMQEYYPALQEERQAIETYLGSLERKARKTSKDVVTELAYVVELLDKFGNSPQVGPLIARKLSELLPRESEIEEMLDHLERIVGQVQRVDTRLFTQLKQVYPKLDPIQKRRVREELQEELGRLNAAQKLRELNVKVREHLAAVKAAVTTAAQALSRGLVEEAKTALRQAVQQEQQATRLIEEMRAFEELIAELVKKELRSIPKQE